ncbi:DJ-1/PfpI family protein [Candidatus Woesearchaeota archaeon]|nr:DJ-1/PfpI family protein [Candidatus Woesearchaeota archaeon]
MKKVLMVIAPENFRDEECFVPKKMFEENDAEVTIASTETGLRKGMLGGEIEATVSYKDINVADYDVIVFVGGTGATVYFDDIHAHSILREAYDLDKLIAAICLAPSTLANAGLLDGKNATVYQSEKSNLESKGAHYTGDNVTVDGKIITANGPHAAKEFAEKLIELW